MTEIIKPETGPSRRTAMKMLAAISAVSAAGCSSSEDRGAVDSVPAAAELSAPQMVFLGALVDTIIPTTDTLGAVAAGVPQTLASLYKDWGDDSFRGFWSSGLNRLSAEFSKMGGQNFGKMSPKQREALLSKYDAKVFDGKIDDAFYKDLKATAAQAYYMSEPGASEELIYEAVPGEWKGCVPFADIGRTWAT